LGLVSTSISITCLAGEELSETVFIFNNSCSLPFTLGSLLAREMLGVDTCALVVGDLVGSSENLTLRVRVGTCAGDLVVGDCVGSSVDLTLGVVMDTRTVGDVGTGVGALWGVIVVLTTGRLVGLIGLETTTLLMVGLDVARVGTGWVVGGGREGLGDNLTGCLVVTVLGVGTAGWILKAFGFKFDNTVGIGLTGLLGVLVLGASSGMDSEVETFSVTETTLRRASIFFWIVCLLPSEVLRSSDSALSKTILLDKDFPVL